MYQMYRTVEFKKEHLEVMDLRQHERKLLETGQFGEYLERGVACTGLVDGRIVCCGGVNLLPGNTADIWLIPSIHVKRHTKVFVKGLREWLFTVANDLGVNRMQTICVNDDLHNRWMKFLGFKKEAIMEKFYNEDDYVMYARTQWD